MDAEAVLLDTNILVSASVTMRALHRAALEVLNEWPKQGKRLFVSGQVLREYAVVATRPAERNGLGLSVADTLYNVAAFRARTVFLSETEAVSQTLRRLIEEVACSGKQIHDANIVATALVHGVENLVTANTDDFKRFEGYLTLLSLRDL